MRERFTIYFPIVGTISWSRNSALDMIIKSKLMIAKVREMLEAKVGSTKLCTVQSIRKKEGGTHGALVQVAVKNGRKSLLGLLFRSKVSELYSKWAHEKV